jgi:hypothetical protein
MRIRVVEREIDVARIVIASYQGHSLPGHCSDGGSRTGVLLCALRREHVRSRLANPSMMRPCRAVCASMGSGVLSPAAALRSLRPLVGGSAACGGLRPNLPHAALVSWRRASTTAPGGASCARGILPNATPCDPRGGDCAVAQGRRTTSWTRSNAKRNWTKISTVLVRGVPLLVPCPTSACRDRVVTPLCPRCTPQPTSNRRSTTPS